MDKESSSCENNSSKWDDDELPKKLQNKWEITPRTSTQSAHLKWDQTPLGIIRIDEGVNSIKGDWDEEKQGSIEKHMTIREINMCLPNDGYDIYTFINDSEDVNESFLFIKPEDKVFFGAIYDSKDEVEIETLKLLLHIKNGDKKAFSQLDNYDTSLLIEKSILMVLSIKLEVEEKVRFLQLANLLLSRTDVESLPFIKELIFIVGSWIDDGALRTHSLKTLETVFAKGRDYVIELIEDDLTQGNSTIREAVAQVISAMLLFYGIDKLGSFLEAMTVSQFYEVKTTFCQTVIKICSLYGKAVVEYLEFLCKCLTTVVKDYNRYLKADAGNAVSMLLSTIYPYSGPETDSLFYILLDDVKNNYPIPSLMRAMSYLCKQNKCFSYALFDILKTRKKIDGDTVKILNRICNNVYESQEYFIAHINSLIYARVNPNVLISLCAKMCATNAELLLGYFMEKELMAIISGVYCRIPLVFSNVDLYVSSLRNALRLDCQEVIQNFDKLLDIRRSNRKVKATTPDISKHRCGAKSGEAVLRNNGSANVQAGNSENGLHEHTINGTHRLSSKLTEGLPVDSSYFDQICTIFYNDSLEFLSIQESKIKGLEMLKHLACRLSPEQLKQCGNILFESIDEQNPAVLAHTLEALAAVYNTAKFKTAQELVPNLLPIIKIKDDKVLLHALNLLNTICKNAVLECNKISLREWMRIVYEITDSFGTWNKSLKHILGDVLSQIAEITGPQEILNIFMTNLVAEDRNIRTNTCVGISMLVKNCGGFFVFPTLMVDYSMPILKLQLGILKSISLCTDIEPYVESLMPLIEDALMEKDIVYRRYGIEIATRICNHSVRICMHLLNFVWMNVFEEGVKNEFNAFIEEATRKVGASVVFKYIVQGVLHPAKKVRERYLELFAIVNAIDRGSVAFCIESVVDES